jgi:hypothetical protein
MACIRCHLSNLNLRQQVYALLESLAESFVSPDRLELSGSTNSNGRYVDTIRSLAVAERSYLTANSYHSPYSPKTKLFRIEFSDLHV